MYICIYILYITTSDLIFKYKNYNNNINSKQLKTTYTNYKPHTYNKWKTNLLNNQTQTSLRYNFTYLNMNLFNYFFTKSGLNIPKDLLNISSVKRTSNNNYLLKFNNYLMLHGSFLKTLLQINKAWGYTTLLHNSQTNHLNWFSVYYNFILEAPQTKQTNTNNLNISSFLLNYVNNHRLMFLIYTYRVSKAIYKNTRGKTGKYMFLCKFIPVYKRSMIILTWLVKELKLIPQRTLLLRILQLVLGLSKSPNKSWPSRIKNFSHTYVYRNCSKTLASNYLSIKI